jgi:hypothetical protein
MAREFYSKAMTGNLKRNRDFPLFNFNAANQKIRNAISRTLA